MSHSRSLPKEWPNSRRRTWACRRRPDGQRHRLLSCRGWMVSRRVTRGWMSRKIDVRKAAINCTPYRAQSARAGGTCIFAARKLDELMIVIGTATDHCGAGRLRSRVRRRSSKFEPSKHTMSLPRLRRGFCRPHDARMNTTHRAAISDLAGALQSRQCDRMGILPRRVGPHALREIIRGRRHTDATLARALDVAKLMGKNSHHRRDGRELFFPAAWWRHTRAMAVLLACRGRAATGRSHARWPRACRLRALAMRIRPHSICSTTSRQRRVRIGSWITMPRSLEVADIRLGSGWAGRARKESAGI